ncbi:endonuclease/exonuclease/phosphatase family protein [Gilvimarinus algae]|uniref:Endonuclease/exonuclease/phosphatase family protein n=1 Tax=Gilvimarinus algae TaxID=3058037 RepID=A0ABT8TGY8_9GAMM|nr:endonuclease/exonuclease/phosphatase family protein [Gilvimarinus sp. SDUM040014]MDO3383357.1 endonuclease/exonuclease/phosphatase family protein [Gilvimarinus sp. SDUM040014]
MLTSLRRLSSFCIVALTLSAALGAQALESASDESAGLTTLAVTAEQCIGELRSSRERAYPDTYPLPDELRVMSWNIYKAQREQLLSDLQALSEQADILLLQEAFADERLSALKPHWRFAPGYRDGDLQTGVLTLSQWPAAVHCHLTHTEPWLRTPKATNIVEYVLAGDERLLVVNLHAINFELSTDSYREQLMAAVGILQEHPGPAIFAGDLNSWSDTRRALLTELLEPLGLQPALFDEDNRTRAFGLALDHVWTRGVSISASSVPQYTSSDHNPLLVTLELEGVNRVAENR